VELCRDVAVRFNGLFGPTFVVPEPVIAKAGARVMSLDDPTRKMEKSNPNANSYILLTDPKDVIAKKFARAVTDSGSEVRATPEKPALTNLLTIYSLLAKKSVAQLEDDYAGKQYGVFKKDLADVVIEALTPIQDKMRAYTEDRAQLQNILENGAQRARERARIKVDLAKERIGLKWR
jgi:tryptophanyl-tRNA synthetase